jgi:Ca-activated chloride channel homolog
VTARPRPVLAVVLCGVLFGALTACLGSGSDPVRLSVLASSELTDLGPLLRDLRRDTGVELAMDHRGTMEVNERLLSGSRRHALAWLSSDRYLRLQLNRSTRTKEQPLSTSTMLSPVVIGLRPEAARRLRQLTGDRELSWADFADGAARGVIRFGMADPHLSNSGLAALVGVATAAAGTGAALRPEDVTCDRLRGFFSGHTLATATSGQLTEAFLRAPGRVDALVNYESVLLSLNRRQLSREPLEIVYPRDGIVMSDYPLMLLDPRQRDAYDRVVAWLKRDRVQREIARLTLRRPLASHVSRPAQLGHPLGNALYFPDQQEVIDRLLRNYDAPQRRTPDQVFFLLDYSDSMKGARIAALRRVFDGLGGADNSASGRFVRFHRGEELTVVRFAGRVLAERRFTVGEGGAIAGLRDFVAADQFDGQTAIWSALAGTFTRAESLVRNDPRRRVSVVLMTDGRNNSGIDAAEFLRRHQRSGVRAYVIRFGEADRAGVSRVAAATGGRVVDADSPASLPDAFKEIRGCR